MELIQSELNNLQAMLRNDLSYAELRKAHAQLFVSAGADLLPESLPDAELATLAAALAESEQRWARGEIF